MAERPPNRYARLLSHVFNANYQEGATRVPFTRSDLVSASQELGVPLPKNLGDAIYAQRYRARIPPSIASRAPYGKRWVIRGTGRSRYEFAAVTFDHVVPNNALVVIKVPDATPELLMANRLGDEQALLAIVRYNRLVDLFLGITAYSMQNHLRTTVAGIGQVEVDELYVGVDRNGGQYIIPVQAKGGRDQIGVVQTEQDLAMCAAKFPKLVARPVAAQFMVDDVIALFELTLQGDDVAIVDEKHYKLVPRDQISDTDLASYRQRSS